MRHVRIDCDADINKRLIFHVNGLTRLDKALCRGIRVLFFSPAGLFHYQIRSVHRYEVLRADIIRILSVAQHFFSDIYTEYVLSHAVLRAVAPVFVVRDSRSPFRIVAGAYNRDEFILLRQHLARKLAYLSYLFFASQNGCCSLDAVDDFLVTGAAAYIAPYGFLYFIFRRIRVSVNKSLSGHYHTRYAETALHRPRCSESIDKCFLFPQTETFYRDDIFARGPVRGENAGFYGAAVHNYGACAACSFRAAVLYRVQLEIIPEISEQRLLFVGSSFYSVYCKCVRNDTHPLCQISQQS